MQHQKRVKSQYHASKSKFQHEYHMSKANQEHLFKISTQYQKKLKFNTIRQNTNKNIYSIYKRDTKKELKVNTIRQNPNINVNTIRTLRNSIFCLQLKVKTIQTPAGIVVADNSLW